MRRFRGVNDLQQRALASGEPDGVIRLEEQLATIDGRNELHQRSASRLNLAMG